jgi:hypothetical protein
VVAASSAWGGFPYVQKIMYKLRTSESIKEQSARVSLPFNSAPSEHDQKEQQKGRTPDIEPRGDANEKPRPGVISNAEYL